jgi:hypothetical protein
VSSPAAFVPSPFPDFPWHDWQCFDHRALPSLMDVASAFTGLAIVLYLSGTGQGFGSWKKLKLAATIKIVIKVIAFVILDFIKFFV